MTLALRTVVLVLVALMSTAAWAQTTGPIGDLLQTLRAGGHVIVFRHGATHNDQADTDPLNLDNVAKQRQLNDPGRAHARAVGWFEVKEGEASIFRVEGGKPVLVARVQIGQWAGR